VFTESITGGPGGLTALIQGAAAAGRQIKRLGGGRDADRGQTTVAGRTLIASVRLRLTNTTTTTWDEDSLAASQSHASVLLAFR